VKMCLAYLDLLEHHLSRGLSSPQLLDIGCAHGFMLEAALERGFQPCGIDISPAVIVARKRGFTTYDRPLQELGLSAGVFDVVTIVDVLEHVPNPQEFMREVGRVLKPQGIVLIVTPNVESWIAKIMRTSWPHYKPEHLLYFSQRSLTMLLQRSGFSVERIGPGFKYLNFDYVLGHFQKYTPGWITMMLRSLHAVLPAVLTKVPVRLPTEMLTIARREAPLKRDWS
jgi:SAM-dependent methyltransferase